MREVDLWCDGSGTSRGNPGGWAYVLIDKESGTEREGFGGALDTTNNQMELWSCIRAFDQLKFACRVTVHSDSEYVIKAFTQDWFSGWRRRQWRGVKNRELWFQLLEAQALHQVTWQWVKGHAKIRLNERCDVLAKNARWAVEQAIKQGTHMDALDFEVLGVPDDQLELA